MKNDFSIKISMQRKKPHIMKKNEKQKSDYTRYDMTEIEMPKNIQKYFDLIDKLHDKYEFYIGDDDDDVMRLLICLIIEVQEKNNDRLKSLESRLYSLEINKNAKKTTSCCVIC